MRLSFDSIEEVKEFVKGLKGTRGGKGGDNDEGASAGGAAANLAPSPILPGPGGAGFPGTGGAGGFAPPGGGAQQTGGAFPAAGVSGPAPEIMAIVQRINARIDGAIASGQKAEDVLAWFRGQCGPDTANFSMDQIKTVALPRASMPTLENIARLMNA